MIWARNGKDTRCSILDEKMMKKRPLSIIIIALIYLFEPVGNLIQAAYINKLPLFGDNSILNHLIWSDWIILA